MAYATPDRPQSVDNPVDNDPGDGQFGRFDDALEYEDRLGPHDDFDDDAEGAIEGDIECDIEDDVQDDLDDGSETTESWSTDGEDIAAAALAGARRGAAMRPRRYDRETRRRIRNENLNGRDRGPDGGRNTPGYSAAGPDPARDPHRIGGLLGNFVDEQGWERPLAEARVFADWAQLVGADIAAHANPQTLTAGELRVAAESTAWATQLRLLSSRLLARLVAELGPDVVTKLIITGPAAPSWRHGGRSVRGHRGPRDTYG